MNTQETRRLLTRYEFGRLDTFAHLLKLHKLTKEHYAPNRWQYGSTQNGVIQERYFDLDDIFAWRVNHMAAEVYSSDFAKDPYLKDIANNLIKTITGRPQETVVFDSSRQK